MKEQLARVSRRTRNLNLTAAAAAQEVQQPTNSHESRTSRILLVHAFLRDNQRSSCLNLELGQSLDTRTVNLE